MSSAEPPKSDHPKLTKDEIRYNWYVGVASLALIVVAMTAVLLWGKNPDARPTVAHLQAGPQ